MKWDNVGELPCSVARALSVLGDRWTILILRNAFMRTRRFDDFQKQLGVTRHVLADRLKKLVDAGVFEKQKYSASPARYEYRLTQKGLDLHPILMSLAAWGDKWLDEGKGVPLEYIHKPCGHKTMPVLVCSACNEPVHPKDIQPIPGPLFTKL